MRRSLVATVLGLGLALSISSARADLLNGSFEPAGSTGSFTLVRGGSSTIPSWVTTDNGVDWLEPAAFGDVAPPDGHFVVDLACHTFTAGGIQQSFATVPGLTYQVTFHLGTKQSSGRDGTAEVVVSAGRSTQTFSIANRSSRTVWTPQLFSFTADDGVATVTFRCLQNASLHYAYLDDVAATSVTQVSPETWGRVKALYR
jgi:hypothetical protein